MVSHLPNERGDATPTVGDWFRRVRLRSTPSTWLFAFLLVAQGSYHLIWRLSDGPYTRTMAVTAATATLIPLLLAVFGRRPEAVVQTGIRVILFVVGAGATLLGAAVIADPQTMADPTLDRVFGGTAFFGGLFVVFAGIYLRGDQTRPGPVPTHVSEARFTLSGGNAILRRFPQFAKGSTDRIVDIAKPLINIGDLHYVAYYVDHSCRFHLDVLADETIAGFFDSATPEQRREGYLSHGRNLDRLISGLNRSFLEIDSGILIRVVLDVEKGALYYYWVDERRFLIGVTLDQEMVDKADRKMVHLVDGVRESLGHKKIGDLER